MRFRKEGTRSSGGGSRVPSSDPRGSTRWSSAPASRRALIDLAPDLLILDEAQRLKNWRTRTAAVVKGLKSRFAFVLTRTPLENRLDDLYSLMQVVDPHRFGPLWRFNEEFTTLDPNGRPVGYRNLDRLRERIAPVVLRRRKEEVLKDLPERLVSRLTVPMAAEQAALHEEAEGTASRLLAILRKRPLNPVEEQRLMRAFQRMRMACDAAGLVDKKTKGAPKLEELERLLEEICLGDGRKVVVFSEWERMQAMAAEVCEKAGVGYVRLQDDASDPILAARRDLVVLADRKRAGASALIAAGQPGEALALLRELLALACRALDPRGDPGADPAALLSAIHGHLLPEKLLTDAEASALARAGEAARAFGASTVAPPEPLAAAVAADAAALVARAKVDVTRGS